MAEHTKLISKHKLHEVGENDTPTHLDGDYEYYLFEGDKYKRPIGSHGLAEPKK